MSMVQYECVECGQHMMTEEEVRRHGCGGGQGMSWTCPECGHRVMGENPGEAHRGWCPARTAKCHRGEHEAISDFPSGGLREKMMWPAAMDVCRHCRSVYMKE